MVVAVNVTSAKESYSFTQMVIEASNGEGFFFEESGFVEICVG